MKAGEECALVESVKAAPGIYAPISGKIVAHNDAVVSAPDVLNQDVYAAWLLKIKPADFEKCAAEFNALMDATTYAKASEEH